MPRPELIETFANPYADRDYEIHMDCDEFTSLCPVGGVESDASDLDLLIQVHTTLPPGKIGLAPEPNLNNRAISYPLGPNAGITEILVPAGYVKVAYDPSFELATDARGRKSYRSRTGTVPTEAPAPGIPFSINFLVEPGMEHVALKAATAYQSASKRRVPPPAFPPLQGEP